MEPNSKASRILRVLAEGPATTAEVAAELDLPIKITCAHLGNLVIRGKARKRRFTGKGHGKTMLWSLPEHDIDRHTHRAPSTPVVHPAPAEFLGDAGAGPSKPRR